MNIKSCNNILGTLLLMAVFLVSCSDPAAEANREEEAELAVIQRQLELDSIELNQYMIANGIDPTSTSVVRHDSGLRYIVLEEGDGDVVEFNDILAVDYVGKFTDGTPFDTSVRSKAITADSLRYIEAGVDFDSLFNAQGQDVELALDSAIRLDTDLPYIIFSSSRNYQPIVYNHVDNADNIAGFIPGFSIGLNELVPNLQENGKGEIFIPSLLAYGTTGTTNGAIPGNTPLVFEITLTRVRP